MEYDQENKKPKIQTCEVCYDEKKCLLCSCGTSVCKECQTRSALPKCLKCWKLFTKTFWTSQNASDLYIKIQKPWEKENLWTRESKLLENTQLFVQWEEAMAQCKKQLRFGLHPTLPPKPSAVLSSGAMFPCPSPECRGYCNLHGECGTCKVLTCIKCKEIVLGNDYKKHACNEQVLASLKIISTESKPCPSCKVNIQKSHGCAHMYCTFCRTHFEWESLKILDKNQSTNFHYLNSPVLNSLHANSQEETRAAECANITELNFNIPKPMVLNDSTPLYEALFHAYSSERRRIIFMKQSLYARDTIDRKHEETLIKLRILYVKQELNKEEYLQKLWNEEHAYEKQIQLSTAWNLYLENMAYLIIDWRTTGYTDSHRYLEKFNCLQDIFQQCFHDIAKDYSSKPPKFKFLVVGETIPLVLL